MVRNLKLDRASGLLLTDGRPLFDDAAWRHILDLQCNEVTSSQFAVYSEIEHGEIAHAFVELKTAPDGPDILRFEGWFLPDELASVPGMAIGFIVAVM